jgi:gas vesicle protein
MSNSRIYYSREAETQAIRQITMMTVLWLAVGLAIGVVMALLFAPSTGQKTRNNLLKSFEEGLDSGQEAIEPVVKKLEKEVGELRQTVEERISKLR